MVTSLIRTSPGRSPRRSRSSADPESSLVIYRFSLVAILVFCVLDDGQSRRGILVLALLSILDDGYDSTRESLRNFFNIGLHEERD